VSETSPRPEDLAFGDALEELETIVAALEGGQLDLEDSLTRYERGVALLRALQAKLSDAQQKVTMLIGELETEQDAAEDAVSLAPEASPET
jgi:exodeoxyribonuclease VII small subunit